jgi:hypothetical protein
MQVKDKMTLSTHPAKIAELKEKINQVQTTAGREFSTFSQLVHYLLENHQKPQETNQEHDQNLKAQIFEQQNQITRLEQQNQILKDANKALNQTTTELLNRHKSPKHTAPTPPLQPQPTPTEKKPLWSPFLKK